MSQKPVAIASDHGGFEMKSLLIEELMRLGYDALDLGCHGPASVDYPDFANAMADALGSGKADRGILLCGSGIGISIAANRHRHVRAALCHDHYTARMARLHNDANVLVLGARTTGVEIARDCLQVFLATEFEGGRHAARVAKLSSAADENV